MAYHLFELLIGRMSYHRLSFASQDSLLDLFLGEPLEILSHCFKHDDSCTRFAKVDIWHAVAKACIALKTYLIALRSCDYPIPLGIVVNDITIFFQLWDR